jgi:imidazolonepropionase-like amidohydrolase
MTMPAVAARCAAFMCVLLLAALPYVATAQDLDLVNVTLVDGTGAAPRVGVSVTVRGGRITTIEERAPPVTPGVRRFDLDGRYLLPGLIDAHAHIESPDAALRALQSGVTTARVLGDTNLQATGTRNLVRAGHVPGPELLVSPGHIRPRPGMAFFEVYPQFGDAINGELRGPERIAGATRALIAQGADVIKVGASERAGLASTDPRKPELTEDEIRAAVTTAAQQGLFVAAHAHSRAGAAAAVRAGVRSIEHGTWLDEPTLQEMRRRGTYFVPTLAVMSPLGDPQGNSADDVALQLRTQRCVARTRSASPWPRPPTAATPTTTTPAASGWRTTSRCCAPTAATRDLSRSRPPPRPVRGCSASTSARARSRSVSKPIWRCSTAIR